MTTAHTTTPWQVTRFRNSWTIRMDTDGTQYPIAEMWESVYSSEKNAAHIVKCVNLHDELVEALERARVYMKEEFNNIDDTGEEFSIVEQIEKSLKKAGAL